MARVDKVVTKDVTAENEFTGIIAPAYQNASKIANISISGSGWVATVTLQRRFGPSDSWKDCRTWAAPEEGRISEYEEEAQYRIGVKTGDYTSGTVKLRMGK